MGDAKLTSPIAFIHIFLRKIYDNNYFTLKAFIPGYTAEAPSSSSILKSWLYLATRSDLDGAPVLIWQVFKATARTAANTEIKVNGKIAENGEYTLALTGDDAKVVTEIEVGNENTVAGKYTVSILREEPVTITFETEPKDAIITVIDKDKIKAGGEDGIY